MQKENTWQIESMDRQSMYEHLQENDHKPIKIRIDYLNKESEVRHTFTDTDNVWRELQNILFYWWTDIWIYKLPQQSDK